MALMITEECISCGACEPACPNEAITQPEALFVVDPERCTECVGFYDDPQCKMVCPVECIVPNPEKVETHEELMAKKEHLDALGGLKRERKARLEFRVG